MKGFSPKQLDRIEREHGWVPIVKALVTEIRAWREQMEKTARWAGEQNDGNAFAGQVRLWALNCLEGDEFNEP